MTLVVVPCAVVLGGVLTWWLAALALAPLTRMADDAKRLGPTRLDRRISRSDAGDEADTLAQALNEALEQIGATFESLNAFAAHASHELRTPLTIVRGEIETALERAADADAIRALESSLVETDRMSHLVEGLLKLARLGAQSLPRTRPRWSWARCWPRSSTTPRCSRARRSRPSGAAGGTRSRSPGPRPSSGEWAGTWWRTRSSTHRPVARSRSP